jgi:Predicted membrane protein (DUF2232)
VFLLSAYVSARIARRLGRLARSWPDIPTMRLPPGTLVVLGVCILLVVLGGWIGLLGGFVGAGLFLLSILDGFAVLHYRARSVPQMRWMVPVAWVAVIALSPFFFTSLIMAGLGVADHVFDLRGIRRAPAP